MFLPVPSRQQFEPGPFCALVQHANHSAIEPPKYTSPIYNKYDYDYHSHKLGDWHTEIVSHEAAAVALGVAAGRCIVVGVTTVDEHQPTQQD